MDAAHWTASPAQTVSPGRASEHLARREAPAELQAKFRALLSAFPAEDAACDSVVVAYSGGLDSAFVLYAALAACGVERVEAVTAASPAVPQREREHAERVARDLGARHRFVETRELERDGYVRNDRDRCFFCKSELYSVLQRLAEESETAWFCNGANIDDLGDHRPGLEAARQNSVHAPLVDAGLHKMEVRMLARALGLAWWDKPASPCLSSRIPYGQAVTPEKLARIEATEDALYRLGFREFRVRCHEEGRLARIELAVGDLPRLVEPELREAAFAAAKQAGFALVTLDLGGLQSGGLNALV